MFGSRGFFSCSRLSLNANLYGCGFHWSGFNGRGFNCRLCFCGSSSCLHGFSLSFGGFCFGWFGSNFCLRRSNSFFSGRSFWRYLGLSGWSSNFFLGSSGFYGCSFHWSGFNGWGFCCGLRFCGRCGCFYSFSLSFGHFCFGRFGGSFCLHRSNGFFCGWSFWSNFGLNGWSGYFFLGWSGFNSVYRGRSDFFSLLCGLSSGRGFFRGLYGDRSGFLGCRCLYGCLWLFRLGCCGLGGSLFLGIQGSGVEARCFVSNVGAGIAFFVVLFVLGYGVGVGVATTTTATTTATFALWVQSAVFAVLVGFGIRVVAGISAVGLGQLFSAVLRFLLGGGHGSNCGHAGRCGSSLFGLGFCAGDVFVQLDVFCAAFFTALTATATAVAWVAAVAAAFVGSGGRRVGALWSFQSRFVTC